MTSKLRFGILSTAHIARKNWKAIRNSGNSTVVAVASRDLQRAQAFIDDCQNDAPMTSPPKAFASYDALLASKDVDAVYIPLPTGLRKEWVIRAAEAGKHIVCEKPCALSVAELRVMTDACRKHRVQFIDGVMFMHSRRLEKIREALNDSDGFGQLKRITSAFSFYGDEAFYAQNIRGNSAMEPFGCLGDLGWYCIRLALWAMNEKLPKSITGRILNEVRGAKSPAPVASEFSGELFFEGGVSSSFYCSFDACNEEWAILTGTKGLVRMSDFVLPFFGNEIAFERINADFEFNACDFNMKPNLRRVPIYEYSNSHPTSQETNLFRNFSRQVLSGKLDESWPQIALNTQRVMTACHQAAREKRAVTIAD